MLETDNYTAANTRETIFSDPRLQQLWDQDRMLGQYLSQTLKLTEPIAWDVYLLYPPHHTWDMTFPPMPTFWMHQLNEEPTLFLDPLRLKQSVQDLLERSIIQ